VGPVEKYLSAPCFRWKTVKKSVKFICPRPSHEQCRSQGVVEDFLGKPPGPLPTGLLKPSKALVTNSGDRASEVKEDSRSSDVESSNTHRMIPSFGEESATRPSGNVEQGGLRPSRSSTNNCASPGGVTVTVLRDNLCCNKRLGETEPNR
jgi:hypothetical protein